MPDLVLPIASLLPESVSPYIALMLIGFAFGILGHLSSARWLVAAGVILIFLGVLLFPLAVTFTEESPRRLDAPEESVRPLQTIP
jgi:hypothetical protein